MPLLEEPATATVEKILFATDFTVFSENAARYAKALAQRFSSEVEIANVFDPSEANSYEEAALGVSLNERRSNSADQLEGIANQFVEVGVKVRAVSPEGYQPAKVLLRLAADDHADLIVVGTQSRQGVERMLLGSTAEELIRSAKCPVLTIGPKVVSPPDGPLNFQSIVFATDFSSGSAKAAMLALSFAEDSGAHLYFCHVVQPYPGWQRDAPIIDPMFIADLKRMVPQCSYDWCSPVCVLEHGEAAQGILGLAEEVHSDLIVVGARKESFLLKHNLDHGLTPQLLLDATCPVMSMC